MILNMLAMNLRCYAQAQCEEMKKYRWIESEKAGFDIGECAYVEWIRKYAKSYREYWNRVNNIVE